MASCIPRFSTANTTPAHGTCRCRSCSTPWRRASSVIPWSVASCWRPSSWPLCWRLWSSCCAAPPARGRWRLALAAVVVGTDTGLQAGTTIGGDLLPVVLQTGALAAVLRARGRPQMIIAGVLAGFAIASKLTATVGVSRRSRPGWRWSGSGDRAAIFAVACIVTARWRCWVPYNCSPEAAYRSTCSTFSLAGVHGAASLWRGPNQVLYQPPRPRPWSCRAAPAGGARSAAVERLAPPVDIPHRVGLCAPVADVRLR